MQKKVDNKLNISESQTNENKRIKELDGIRGIAALLIITWHYGTSQLVNNHSLIAGYFRVATTYFWTGVDLFFILSGFLLGGILLKNKLSKNYFKTFYVRRICRIFPIYYLVLIVVFVICFLGIGYSTDWWFNDKIPYWPYLFYCQNIFIAFAETLGNRWISHTWSLGLEEQFYLILPLLIYFLNRKYLVIVLSICVLAAPILRHISGNWFQTFNLIYFRFDSLFSGVLIAVAMQSEKVVSFFKRYNNLFTVILFLLLLLSILFSLNKIHLNYLSSNSWFALVFANFILVVLTNSKNIFAIICRNKILVKVGVISYGMYLYHPVVAGLMHFIFKNQTPRMMNISDLILTVLSFIITIFIAHFSFKYFEKRGINFGHKFKY